MARLLHKADAHSLSGSWASCCYRRVRLAQVTVHVSGVDDAHVVDWHQRTSRVHDERHGWCDRRRVQVVTDRTGRHRPHRSRPARHYAATAFSPETQPPTTWPS